MLSLGYGERMKRLYLWDNGNSGILDEDMTPIAKGQWIENCKFCGGIPKIVRDKEVFCPNTDCINNRPYPLDEWAQEEITSEPQDRSPEKRFKDLESRVKRLEELFRRSDENRSCR